MKIAFIEPVLPTRGALAVGAGKGGKLSPPAADLDKRTNGAISRAIKASRFKGGKGEHVDVLAPAGIRTNHVMVVGLDNPAKLTAADFRAIGGRIVANFNRVGAKDGMILIGPGSADNDLSLAERAAQIAYGARLRSYRFDKYRTKQKPEVKPTLVNLKIAVNGAAKAQRAFGSLDKVADGVFLTRDLVSEPPNILYPETLAQQARTLTKLGVKVEVLGEKKMAQLGMGALLGVGQGSDRPSQMVVMQWNGNPKARNKHPVAFIGKGVTFDTGGISIKPSANMHDMKWDMGGSGVVIGLMKALAGRKAKVNAVGVVGLVENMPGGNAQRPGDIVTTMSGTTVEVLNTDAEGRLVLADALWYCQDRFKPRFMIDLATLTGAIIVSLGHEYAGLFANDDKLAGQLLAAGEEEVEPVWRMPLCESFDKDINSDVADIKNIGSGRGAGSSTAAHFLQRFVNDVPWAHLDIAGVTWSKKPSPVAPGGGTGYGVRLLDRLVRDHYEG